MNYKQALTHNIFKVISESSKQLQLDSYVIGGFVRDYILKYTTKPTTVIYDRPLLVAENLIALDNSLAIRVVGESFASILTKKFKKPIVSTSANISGKSSPKSFKEISEEILKGVDYVVNLPNAKSSSKPSSIIKLSDDGKVQVIRK